MLSDYFNKLFLITIIVYNIQGVLSDTGTCDPTGQCGCKYDTYYGYNLEPLAQTIAANSLTTGSLQNNLTFFYHPCGNVIPKNNNSVDFNCTEYSLCMYNATDNSSKVLGFYNETTFKVINSIIHLEFTKKGVTSALIELACTNIDESFLYLLPNSTSHVEQSLILYSKHACLMKYDQPEGLSTGAILLLVPLLLLAIYLVLGILVNYFFIGARGLEVIPNLSFWTDLPSLVKDGAVFIQNGCKVQPSDLTHNQQSYSSI